MDYVRRDIESAIDAWAQDKDGHAVFEVVGLRGSGKSTLLRHYAAAGDIGGVPVLGSLLRDPEPGLRQGSLTPWGLRDAMVRGASWYLGELAEVAARRSPKIHKTLAVTGGITVGGNMHVDLSTPTRDADATRTEVLDEIAALCAFLDRDQRQLIVIVDALDEARDDDPSAQLPNLVGELADRLASNLRWLVSTRPGSPLRVPPTKRQSAQISADRAIEEYLRDQLGAILGHETPAVRELARDYAEFASHSFRWARKLVCYAADDLAAGKVPDAMTWRPSSDHRDAYWLEAREYESRIKHRWRSAGLNHTQAEVALGLLVAANEPGVSRTTVRDIVGFEDASSLTFVDSVRHMIRGEPEQGMQVDHLEVRGYYFGEHVLSVSEANARLALWGHRRARLDEPGRAVDAVPRWDDKSQRYALENTATHYETALAHHPTPELRAELEAGWRSLVADAGWINSTWAVRGLDALMRELAAQRSTASADQPTEESP